MLVELGLVEQRYQAVLEVLNGVPVTEVARQTVHDWLRRYGSQGMTGLVDRSSKPFSCPHQTPAARRRDHGRGVSAVDLTTMQILVLASASEAHGQLQFGPPKNWRRRSAPLPSGLAEDLTNHIRGKAPREFVFTSARGTPVRQSNFHARHFKPPPSG